MLPFLRSPFLRRKTGRTASKCKWIRPPLSEWRPFYALSAARTGSVDTATVAIRDLEARKTAKLLAAGKPSRPEHDVSRRLLRLPRSSPFGRGVAQLLRTAVCGPACPLVWQVVSRRHGKRHAVRKMKVHPSEPLCRGASNSREPLRSKTAVVNVTVKRRDTRPRHVGIRETNANEPPTTPRNTTPTISEPELPARAGGSTAATYSLAVRCPV